MSQAIIQMRRALTLFEQLPDPSARSKTHNRLALYLERRGTPSDLTESPRHQLAALIYSPSNPKVLLTAFGNYVIAFRRAQAAGTVLVIPRLAELLADPAFAPLEQWLRQRQVDVPQMQAAADQMFDETRQAALAER
jgi:hypothetical protein